MKKLIYLLTIGMMVFMTSCKKDHVRYYDKSAGEGIAGTYTGMWMMVDDKGSESQAEGTVVFAAVEGETNIALMTVKSDALSLASSTKVNVAHSEDEYIFFNNNATDLLPADAPEDASIPTFRGIVKVDGSTGFSYSLKTGKGKKAKVVTYTFAGAR